VDARISRLRASGLIRYRPDLALLEIGMVLFSGPMIVSDDAVR